MSAVTDAPKASGIVRRFIAEVIVAPWDRIDSAYKGQRVGRLSARQGAFVTVITTCLMLVFLRFVVMDRTVQAAFASTLCELGGLIAGDGVRELMYRYHRLMVNCSWVMGCFLCYFVVPGLIVRQVFGLTLSDFYLKPRNYVRHLPIYGLLFLPVGLLILVFAGSPDFAMQYPFYKNQQGWADLLIWEAAYGVQFFALEFFFRGFVLRGLAAEMGSMAVLTMAIPYCMIHYGKPLPECLGSIIAGITLGVLAMDTRSIWGGVTIHVAVAWGMDFAALGQKGVLDKLN
ncbi:MAG: CPBP family intramembrane metalloprotease [Myxococcales bacterium]|nr:CPBP family intramembrane metalloprotease [Myxococcales bacterium]